jgi:hypothetical protein
MRINRLERDQVEMCDDTRVIYVNYHYDIRRYGLTIYKATIQDMLIDPENWDEEERPYKLTDSEEEELLEWLEDDYYMNEGLVDLLG